MRSLRCKTIAWHCGMRREEARSVEGEHINLDAHHIEIPENKARDRAATAFVSPEFDKFLRRRWPDGPPPGKLIHYDAGYTLPKSV
jgi:integrase